jgi:nitrogen fixation NifU-like protein
METDELEELYGEAVLDHCRNPRGHRKLEDAEIVAASVNPFCGDEVHVQINLDEGGRVSAVGLQSVGCSINQASGSMLADVIEGRSLEQIEALHAAFRAMFVADASNPAPELPGELATLYGVRAFPVRVKCALLAWSALEEGVERYRRQGQGRRSLLR